MLLAAQEKWSEAIGDFDAALRADPNDFYAALYRCVAQMRLGESWEAKKQLTAALGQRRGAKPGDWPSRVAEFLLGQLDEAALLTAAEDANAEKTRGQKCEAWFYAGVARLAAEQKAEAASCLRKCVATEEKSYFEYEMAQAELRRLL